MSKCPISFYNKPILISEHFVKWIFFEKIALFDIAVDHFFGFVAGLAHDGEGVQVVLGGAGGEASAEAVAGEVLGVHA